MSSDPTASSRSCSPSGPSRIRVVLVDDDGLIRQGLRKIVEDCVSLEVVGEASNGLEAIEAVRLLRPDVVVMDINMPQMNGIDATSALKVSSQTPSSSDCLWNRIRHGSGDGISGHLCLFGERVRRGCFVPSH
jgi:PleD family two-component response regulator